MTLAKTYKTQKKNRFEFQRPFCKQTAQSSYFWPEWILTQTGKRCILLDTIRLFAVRAEDAEKMNRSVKEEPFYESIHPLAGHDGPAPEPSSRKNHVVSLFQ